MRIVWGVTGAGHRLRAILEVFREIVGRGHSVTTVMSRAGMSVARIYGVEEGIREVSEEVWGDEAAGYPVAGRMMMGEYDVYVVAPATGNTVAKMVLGIADTIVTTVFAMAQKGGVPVIVLPTDSRETITELPCMVRKDLCTGCGECLSICPSGAISIDGGVAHIDLRLCNGCSLCPAACPYGAISCWALSKVRVREVDVRNVEGLRRMGVHVVEEPAELLALLKSLESV